MSFLSLLYEFTWLHYSDVWRVSVEEWFGALVPCLISVPTPHETGIPVQGGVLPLDPNQGSQSAQHSGFIVFTVFRSAKRRYEVLDGSKDKGLCLIFDALVHVEGGAERASTAHKISCGTIQLYYMANHVFHISSSIHRVVQKFCVSSIDFLKVYRVFHKTWTTLF